ncbi:hypothetical protein [Sporohalobacter salinus]|uniref:hypothetical protein n=1 Tax=Sporohalobacter salinus TaxID=1494606 RepID=UPI00195F98C1|nr:hypothetical protein [Sporohalobacter salinus]MBM7625097.1 NhaP-type Na+/H+ or K+/H+ antiporter [Sporohalobacter salinus]
MELNKQKILNQLKAMIVVGIMIVIGQRVGYGMSISKAIPGIILVLGIAMLALIIKDLFPNIKFPAFAWASLTALILSMPFMPTSKLFLKYTDQVSFLGTTTPILAFAGISVGNKMETLKKLSWRVLIIAIAVFIGTFFGSAIISHFILKFQGII